MKATAASASCSCHAGACLRHAACSKHASHTPKNTRISTLLRTSASAGTRRFAQKYPATATDRPLIAATFNTSTTRWPKGVCPSLRRSGWRLTTHSTMPVAAIPVPTTPDKNSSQRTAGSAKRPRCTLTMLFITAMVAEGGRTAGASFSAPLMPSNTRRWPAPRPCNKLRVPDARNSTVAWAVWGFCTTMLPTVCPCHCCCAICSSGAIGAKACVAPACASCCAARSRCARLRSPVWGAAAICMPRRSALKRCGSPSYTAYAPHGINMVISSSKPLNVITKWNGKANTAKALCASNQERCPLRGRKVKKSLKIFLCVMTPLMMAMSITMVATPTIQRPQIRGMAYSSK